MILDKKEIQSTNNPLQDVKYITNELENFKKECIEKFNIKDVTQYEFTVKNVGGNIVFAIRK